MARGRRIGRLKLIPPEPKIADYYLYAWDNKTLYLNPDTFPPIIAETFFEQSAPLNIDIGCGSGEFLCGLAQENPDKFYLGIDISQKAIFTAVNTAAKLGLENIKFIKADFKLLYPLLLPNTFENVYMNFPDPNYGGKHLKRRIVNKIFLDHMTTALLPDGKINLVTDQQELFEDMETLILEDARFIKTHAERYLTETGHAHKTRFQEAWERRQRPIFRVELVKNKT